MTRRDEIDRLLRWYPESWRARYGDEFVALIEDRLGGSSPTMALRASLAVAGVRERCHASGIIGSQSAPSTQRRTGSLMVLVAWSIMIVGGAGLAKTAEHFAASIPDLSRGGAQFAYNLVAVAGMVGSLLVVAGAFVAIPGLIRLIRARHGADVRPLFARPLIASGLLVLATAGLSSWAHHLVSAQRNGGDQLYSGAFGVFALLVVVTIGLWLRAGITLASRINFTSRALRWESWLAFGVSLSSIVVIGGTTLWWIEMSLHAPWFLEGTAVGVPTSPWSPNLIATVLVMALATAIALWGASRAALTYRSVR